MTDSLGQDEKELLLALKKEEEEQEAEKATDANEEGVDAEVVHPESDWQRRHREKQQHKEERRNQIQSAGSNYEENKSYFRPAKPKSSVYDDEEKTVAVYARVSTSSEQQTSSIENQTLYYTQKIAENPNWQMQEIYSDEGKSGTSIAHRPEFQRMMQAAKNKSFDMIICASVSRFARNISDCLDQIQQLKNMNPAHPIGVYFETENIYTLDTKSDEALEIHALLADWESKNKSRRMILSYDQRIATGQYQIVDLFGYRHTKDGQLIIQPDEADTVRYIYLAYLKGDSCEEIANVLTEKKRPTMQGREEWNDGMVRNVMKNERRWGDLEARKTIVFDYKKRLIVKNNNERCSAYVPHHHEGIVSPEIAKAAKFVAESSRKLNGVPELGLIEQGALKGFVSVNPAWSGVDAETYMDVCMSVYDDQELEQLNTRNLIRNGTGHSKITPLDMAGYKVPYGILFLTNKMPSLTITHHSIRFNNACHKRLGDCRYIEMFYHPVLQAVAIRASDESSPLAFSWENEEGRPLNSIPSRGFSNAVYDIMDWVDDLRFKFRGITKERGDTTIMFFFLDEPQILIDKKRKKELSQLSDDTLESTGRFIPFRKSDSVDDNALEGKYGYPEEWKVQMGMDDNAKQYRDETLMSVTEGDVAETGTLVENPMIGSLPSRSEITSELEKLLMSM